MATGKQAHLVSKFVRGKVVLSVWVVWSCSFAQPTQIVKIIPTRCNICLLFFAKALLYMFRETISPIIRSTCAVYGHR